MGYVGGQCDQYGVKFAGYTDLIYGNNTVQQIYDNFEWCADLFLPQPVMYKIYEMYERFIQINFRNTSIGVKYTFTSNVSPPVKEYQYNPGKIQFVLACPLNRGINFWINIKKKG